MDDVPDILQQKDQTTAADLSQAPATTRWYRLHGRASRKDKAAKQQYWKKQLSRTLATDDVPLPGKNWPRVFYQRHPELRARRTKAIDCKRHEQNIFEKVSEWFDVMRKEFDNPAILAENVYNIDETGVMLSVLGSIKVLVDHDDLRATRPSYVQRTLITAIECISADGRCLDPLIIWPAVTHRSTWTAYPTPGWHFACTKTGYTDPAISLYWVQHVFDPLTRARAKGKPRLLISDGFGTHESLEVLTYCFQNNIVLCRLPSHTSHKLQPCDIGVFGPLKTAYRERVGHLYRGGAKVIGKPHFTSLYSKARQTALTPRNIRAGWSKAALFPFNPSRVLDNMQPPVVNPNTAGENAPGQAPQTFSQALTTPTTLMDFNDVRCKLESTLDPEDKQARMCLQKIANAAGHVYADRALLFDENRILFEQNNEKSMRNSTRTTIVGRAKVMSYEDIVEAQRTRSEKETRRTPCNQPTGIFRAPVARMLSEADEEALKAEQEIANMGLTQYCHVLDLGNLEQASSLRNILFRMVRSYDGEVTKADGVYHKFQLQANAGTHSVMATGYVKKDGTKEDAENGLKEAAASVKL